MSRAPKPPLQPREPDAFEQPSSGPAAHSAADEIGQGGGEIQSAPEEIDGLPTGRTGQDDRH